MSPAQRFTAHYRARRDWGTFMHFVRQSRNSRDKAYWLGMAADARRTMQAMA